jgi:hypothetical protein
MSRRPLNIHGHPLSDAYGFDVLGDLNVKRDSLFLPKAWIIVDNDIPPSISPRLQVLLSRISDVSPRWDNAIAHNILPGYFSLSLPEIYFRDEKPQAMYLALCIMHDNTRMLPQTLGLERIIELAHFTEKYGLHRIIMKYMDPWLALHVPYITEAGYESWLFVAYTLGLHKSYLTLADHLAMHCEIDDNNRLLKLGARSPLEPINVPHAHCKIDPVHTIKDLC